MVLVGPSNVTAMAPLAMRYTAVVFGLLATSAATTVSVNPPTSVLNHGSSTSSAAALVTPSTYTVPGAFPTSVFSKYYANPTQTASQVQPVIKDPVTGETYPLDLTDPDTIPTNNTVDPLPLPPKASSSLILTSALEQLSNIAASPFYAGNKCGACLAGLQVAKFVTLAEPTLGPELTVAACQQFKFSSTCATTYGARGLGAVITQVVANADVGGFDGQMLCQNFLSGLCPLPPPSRLNLTSWFAKPKPSPLPAPKKPSGVRLPVLHMSDAHLDPRYATGAEANCTSGLCCRRNNFASGSPNQTIFPAPRFGTYKCDSPYALILSALEAIPELTGTKETGFAWSLYTGDLVGHDPDNQLSQDYIKYHETVLYGLFRKMLGSGPVYAALGNHDSYNQAQDAPHALGGQLGKQFQWNYDHVASLWEHEEWLPQAAVKQAKANYAAYAVQRKDGLRVITLNADLWYRSNYFNYINMTSGDNSGMLRFLTDELQEAEDAGERVWIVAHVLSGWDGSNPLVNPTNLFYQIVDRFSPHVIANIFFGHTHEDQLSIFYANNGTVMSAETAQAVSWIGPSITPLTNLNSGFRMYEVDSATFDIYEAYTWRSDVNTYPELDAQLEAGPSYGFEYSTREVYGTPIDWPAAAPLNATFWHRVTEQMEADNSLVATFNTFQGKSSVRTKPCTGTCIQAKICYIRSGSAPIGKQCPQGYGSVQS